MKKFIVTVLSISVFFIGLGTLLEKASASDLMAACAVPGTT